MGANPARQRRHSSWSISGCPTSAGIAIAVAQPASETHESTRPLGKMLRDIFTQQRRAGELPPLLSRRDRTRTVWTDVFDVENRCFVGPAIGIDDHVSPDGRVMEVLSEHNCEGWLEGYLLTGRHGLFASYEAFAMVSASMVVQHAKWLAERGLTLPWRGADRLARTSC